MTPWHGKENIIEVLVAPTVTDLITVDFAKSALNITTSDEDAFITMLIETAYDLLGGYDGMVGKALLNTTYTFKTRNFEELMDLPGGRVSSVTEIRYIDGDGANQTFDVGNVMIITDGDSAYLETLPGVAWPGSLQDRADAIEIDYVAGYGGTGASVPATIRQAALLLIGHYYEHREAVTTTGPSNFPKKLEMGVESLIAKEKIGWIAS